MSLWRQLQHAPSLLLGALLLWACTALAQQLWQVPALTARVMDLSSTLSPAQLQQLESKLAAFEAEQGAQIVVLLLPSTQPEDISSLANRVFNTWKPGRAGIGDGVLIVAAMQDRKLRIEVARALEGAIPDLLAKRIIDEVLTPNFRQGDFYGGLSLASERLMGLIRGEKLPAPAAPKPGVDQTDWMNLAVVLFILLPVAGSLLRRIMGHKLGTLATGGLMAFVTFSFTASLVLAAIAALLAMLLTFIAGAPLGHALLTSAQSRHHHRGHWGDGGFGGGGFGGGGFGSGGGGDGAGGGASGSW